MRSSLVLYIISVHSNQQLNYLRNIKESYDLKVTSLFGVVDSCMLEWFSTELEILRNTRLE